MPDACDYGFFYFVSYIFKKQKTAHSLLDVDSICGGIYSVLLYKVPAAVSDVLHLGECFYSITFIGNAVRTICSNQS